MTQPPDPVGEQIDEDDEVAELLLADAVAADAATGPDMGEPNRPDMGEPLSQPTPTPPPAQPATAVPAPSAQPAAPPAPVVAAPAGAATSNPGAATVPPFVAPTPPPGGAPNVDGFDYPENTPLAQMTAAQQAEYWRHKARKHEDRVKAMGDYDDLKKVADQYQGLVTASQTEHERAVAEAHRQGRAEALSAAGGQLVEQWMRAATAGRLPEESVNALLAGLDRSRFLAQDGSVDTGKVYGFVNSIAPAASPPSPPGQPAPTAPAQQQPVAAAAPPVVTPAGGPDFGHGQPGTSRPSGIALGAEIARQRFAKPQT